MTAIVRWFRRIGYLLNRRSHEAALRQEMDAHRERMPQPTRFGNELALREAAHDVWGWQSLDAVARDVRLATRALLRSRGYSAAVVTSLALGLTLVATIAAIVNAYLLRPLPYPAADRLYHVMYAPAGPWEPPNVSQIDWNALRDVVDFPITAAGETYYIGESGYSSPARGLQAGPGFLTGLGVRPTIGRAFTPAEFTPGSEPVALIGDALWRSRFGGDSAIVGRIIHADAEGNATPATFRVVGVLPPGFWFGRESSSTIDVMAPLRAPYQTYMVRLRPGVAASVAERRLTEATRQVAGALPPDWPGVHLESMRERYVATVRPVLLGITVAALMVMAIVWANVAILTLLRAMRRQKELSVRVGLGAQWTHVARMLAAETVLLAAAAVSIAALATTVLLRVLGSLIETRLARPAPAGAASITLDAGVLLAVAGAGLLIALSLAFLPLLTSWRRLAEALQGGARSTGDSRTTRRARLLLIVLEVAGSLVLLAGCGAMLRHVADRVHTDLGMRTDHLARVAMVVPGRAYADSGALLAYYQRLSGRVSALVNSPVAYAGWPPYFEFPERPFAADGAAGDKNSAGYSTAGPGYFAMLGIPMRQGREFASSDLPGSEPVAIVSEALAERLWPGAPAIGHRIRTIEPNGAAIATQWRTIVGVAANVRQTYDDEQLRDVYVPYYQAAPGRYGAFYIRSDEPAPRLLEQLRAGIGAIAPLATVRWVNRVSSEDSALAQAKFLTTLLAAFAAFAALLAVLGIYGVMAYAVRQREREIAIRVAIGASSGAVTALFLRHGGIVLTTGIGAGLLASAAMVRVLTSQFTGIRQFDLVTVLSAALFLGVAGMLAIWWPARRAAAIDPIVALRLE